MLLSRGRTGDNILPAQEVVQNYHTRCKFPKCTIKIDIIKAFDSVYWRFMEHVLKAFLLPPPLVHWILSCISTLMFSIMINGKPQGYFHGRRRLKTRDPISPYLFIMCMEILSRLLDKAVSEGRYGYRRKCKVLDLTHLI